MARPTLIVTIALKCTDENVVNKVDYLLYFIMYTYLN